MTFIGLSTFSSCRGKAAVKTIETAEKVLQKTPKKTPNIITATTLPASSPALNSGRYSDVAARLVEEISEDDAYSFEDDNDD